MCRPFPAGTRASLALSITTPISHRLLQQEFLPGQLDHFSVALPPEQQLGIYATYLADAVYDNQTNVREAQRVADAVAEHIKTRPGDSLGVVTLNIRQRDRIAELLDERLRSVRGADGYREK